MKSFEFLSHCLIRKLKQRKRLSVSIGSLEPSLVGIQNTIYQSSVWLAGISKTKIVSLTMHLFILLYEIVFFMLSIYLKVKIILY